MRKTSDISSEEPDAAAERLISKNGANAEMVALDNAADELSFGNKEAASYWRDVFHCIRKRR